MEVGKKLGIEGKGVFLYLNPDMWPYTVRHATHSLREEHILKPGDLELRCVDVAGHRLYAIFYEPQHVFGVMLSWGNPGLGLSIRGGEQLLLKGLDDLKEVPLDKDQIDQVAPLPEPTWTPESEAHDGLRERIAHLVNRAPNANTPPTVEVSHKHVFLYPTGMAAIHQSSRRVLEHRPGTIVVLGVVFHNTYHHFLEESPHGFKHVGKVDDKSIDEFESWLDEQSEQNKPVSYVIVEVPGNPTLETPDLVRLKKLVSLHSVMPVPQPLESCSIKKDLL